jgi:hypothetical protein
MLAREIQSVFNGPRDPLRRIQRASHIFVGLPIMCVLDDCQNYQRALEHYYSPITGGRRNRVTPADKTKRNPHRGCGGLRRVQLRQLH